MIYLDNAAGQIPIFYRKQYELQNEIWFNSNANYAFKTQKEIEKHKERIKEYLGLKNGKLLFFRSSTEIIEWLAKHFPIGQIKCNNYEHDSVYNSCSLVPYNANCVEAMVQQAVNQVTGEVFDIATIAKKEKQHYKYFLVDFVAGIGHIPIPTDIENFCDALWFSGYKIGTEKNIACLWISNRLAKRLGASKNPKNQYGLVHGDIDVAGVCSITDAVSVCYNPTNILVYEQLWHNMTDYLIQKLKENGIRAYIVNKNRNKTYAINALCLLDLNADTLQQYLASKNIFVGLGASACADKHDYRVLNALLIDNKTAEHIIRISYDTLINQDIIDKFVSAIIDFKKLFI